MELDGIFSGLRAMPAREVAEELHGWRHGESADFALLVGAVTTLAREVAAVTHKVDGLTQIGPLARIGAEAELDAFERWQAEPQPLIIEPSGKLALVYAGLREVRSMIATGWQQTERIADPLNRSLSRGGLLQAIDLRLAAMLEAGGIESTDDQS